MTRTTLVPVNNGVHSTELPGELRTARLCGAATLFDHLVQRTSGRLVVVATLVCAIAAALVVWLVTPVHGPVDLDVYRAGMSILFRGGDPYAGTVGPTNLNFTYPPFALFALAPLNALAVGPTEVLWWLVSVAALGLSFWLVACRGRTRWSRGPAIAVLCIVGAECFALEPARTTLSYGQVNSVLMAVVLADLLWAKRFRGVGSGLAAAIKLTPVLFLVLLALEKDWRSLKRMVTTIAVATGAAWLMAPRASGDFWFHKAIHVTRIGSLRYSGNQSLVGLFHRMAISGHVATALWIVLSAIAISSTLVVTKWCTDKGAREVAILAVAICGLVVSPISWSHHWIWIALVPALAIGDRYQSLALLGRATLLPWALLGLTLFAPYTWDVPGVAGQVGDDALVACAMVFLLIWAVAIRKGEDRAVRCGSHGSSLRLVQDVQIKDLPPSVTRWRNDKAPTTGRPSRS